MTLKEFYKRARRVKWIVKKNGAIRTKNRQGTGNNRNHKCPLAYVFDTWSAIDAHELGLAYSLGAMIIARADGDAGWRGRYRLKRALGLAK